MKKTLEVTGRDDLKEAIVEFVVVYVVTGVITTGVMCSVFGLIGLTMGGRKNQIDKGEA